MITVRWVIFAGPKFVSVSLSSSPPCYSGYCSPCYPATLPPALPVTTLPGTILMTLAATLLPATTLFPTLPPPLLYLLPKSSGNNILYTHCGCGHSAAMWVHKDASTKKEVKARQRTEQRTESWPWPQLLQIII